MVAYVTKSTHPDLFFGLKGGFNNFVSFLAHVVAIRSLTRNFPGNRDRFHDEDISTSRRMGADYHIFVVDESSLTSSSGRTNRVLLCRV